PSEPTSSEATSPEGAYVPSPRLRLEVDILSTEMPPAAASPPDEPRAPAPPEPGAALRRLACLVALVFVPLAASAQVYVVANGNDAGLGSLRAAIIQANGDPGSLVTFEPGVSVVTLTTTQLLVSEDMMIEGPSTGVTIQAAPGSRVFEIEDGATVEMENLTITGGDVDGDGGGILSHGVLYLTDVVVTGNEATL